MAPTPRAWQDRVKTEIAKVRGKYLSTKFITRLQNGPATRVPNATFRAWLANEVQAGRIKVATSTMTRDHALAAPLARDVATARTREDVVGDGSALQSIRRKVRKWVDKSTAGATGLPHLTPPMVHSLLHSQCKQGQTAAQIEAVLVTLAAKGELTITWRPTHPSRGTTLAIRDAMSQAEHTMTAEGWVTAQEAHQIVEKARGRITTADHSKVALDLGLGWGGAKEGLSRILTTYGVDKARQSTGDKEGMTVPDLLTDFAQGQGRLVAKLATQAKVRRGELYHVHGSVDCTPESTLNRLEAAQGRGKGGNAGKPRPAEQTAAVDEVVKGVQEYLSRDPHLTYTLEQPSEGALKDSPTLARLPGKATVVKYCCYGGKTQKPTRIWHNLTEWQPRCQEGPGWLRTCPHCIHCRENSRHPECIVRRGPEDGRPMLQYEGFTQKASKNRIPPDLAEEWAMASLKQHAAQ